MRKIFFTCAVSFAFIAGILSCSKCYDCSHEVEIQTASGTKKDTVTDEFCTASSEEVKQKEQNGYTCVDK